MNSQINETNNSNTGTTLSSNKWNISLPDEIDIYPRGSNLSISSGRTVTDIEREDILSPNFSNNFSNKRFVSSISNDMDYFTDFNRNGKEVG